MLRIFKISYLLILISLLYACSSSVEIANEVVNPNANTEYLIGPGDTLDVFVWRNPDISVTVPVRPDGHISTPLVEDILAIDKSPTELARLIEQRLSKYIRNPVVTVIVKNFVGTYNKQIRVIGQATEPKALSYRENMTVLDVMIAVGGLTEFAAGNNAKLIRRKGSKTVQYSVRLKDLIKDGDITANTYVMPGDILLIPESLF